MEDKIHSACKNCGSTLDEQSAYCSQCGQSVGDSKLTISALINHFWNSLFNIDNTIFRTLSYILKPWKLTQAYVEGKRKTYFHPVRYYLVAVFILALTFYFDNVGINKNMDFFKPQNNYILSLALEKLDHVSNKMQPDEGQCNLIDSIKSEVFEGVTFPELDTISYLNMDSEVSVGVDNTMKILRKDALNMSNNEIFEKYNIKGFINKITTSRQIRTYRDSAGLIDFLQKYILWAIFLTIIAMGFIMKLFYWKKFVVEHWVFLLYFHASCLLFFALLNVVIILIPNMEWTLFMVALFLPLFFAYNVYVYYGDTKVISLFKTSMLLLLYSLTTLIMVLATIFTGFLVF